MSHNAELASWLRIGLVLGISPQLGPLQNQPGHMHIRLRLPTLVSLNGGGCLTASLIGCPVVRVPARVPLCCTCMGAGQPGASLVVMKAPGVTETGIPQLTDLLASFENCLPSPACQTQILHAPWLVGRWEPICRPLPPPCPCWLLQSPLLVPG